MADPPQLSISEPDAAPNEPTNAVKIGRAMAGFWTVKLGSQETLLEYFSRVSRLRDHLQSQWHKIEISDTMLALAILRGLPRYWDPIVGKIPIHGHSDEFEDPITLDFVRDLFTPDISEPGSLSLLKDKPSVDDNFFPLTPLSRDLPLPNELLITILQIIFSTTKIFEHVYIKLVCRRWRNISLKYGHRTMSFDGEAGSWRYILYNQSLSEIPARSALLLRFHIFDAPYAVYPYVYAIINKLRQLRTFFMAWGDDAYPPEPFEQFSFPASLQELTLKSLVVSVVHPVPQEKDNFTKKTANKLEALLSSLGRCTNLRGLCLALPFLCLPKNLCLPNLRSFVILDAPMELEMNRLLVSLDSNRHNLRVLDVEFAVQTPGLDTSLLFTFFSLSSNSLVHLSIQVLSESHHHVLFQARTDSEEISTLSLPALPNLQFLKLHLDLNISSSFSLDSMFPLLAQSIHLTEICLSGRALLTHRSSLRFLERLDLGFIAVPPMTGSILPSLSSSKEFCYHFQSTLRYLALPHWTTIDDDISATMEFIHLFKQLMTLVITLLEDETYTLLPSCSSLKAQRSPVDTLSSSFPFAPGFVYFDNLRYLKLPYRQHLAPIFTTTTWKQHLPKVQGVWMTASWNDYQHFVKNTKTSLEERLKLEGIEFAWNSFGSEEIRYGWQRRFFRN
ncbi:hypothetical protein BT69DRAFT_1345448 [Atractiella rhizophila]|nr:hypothetical protein BT69DRAFT_1345448 [Atractiella rhizophila]